MVESDANRKLAAILSADVVGYGQLMQDDEPATVATLIEYRAAISGVVERHKGRVVNAPGDNILAEFPSAVEGVQAAVEIQKVLEGRNFELPTERRMEFRIGLNLGDVIEEDDGTIYGDGVNIAARMEALAETGGICISDTVYQSVETKLDFGFDFLGEQPVKNVAKPVRVYRVRAETKGIQDKAPNAVARRRPIVLIAALSVVLVAGGVLWALYPKAPPPDVIAADGTPTDDANLAMPTGPSIAVLPFDNLSGDPEEKYFADGIAEDVLTQLSRFSKLKVIGRNSSFQYRGEAVDAQKVGRELGAAYVLEGSVRRTADMIRVTAQLLDASDGAHIWADAYDRTLTTTNIFSIQDDISQRVVAMIAGSGGAISRQLRQDVKRKRTEDLDAYECVLSYATYYEIYTAEAHLRLRTCLERTVDADPYNADAWAALFSVYNDEYRIGYNRRGDAYDPLERAFESAQLAVELDGNNPFARVSLATAYFSRHELDAFFAEAERALALNPNDVETLEALSYAIAYAGDWERGMALLSKAAELNPIHPNWYHLLFSFDHYRMGDYAQALVRAQQTNSPKWWRQYLGTTIAFAQLGRTDEAAAALETMLDLYPDVGTDPWGEFRKWNWSGEWLAHVMDGLKKAGLEIPDDPEIAD
jgi:adenylate cyclase